MSWIAPTTDDVLSEFTPAERAQIERVQNATGSLAAILSRTVAEVRDAIRSGGYELDADATTLPLGLHNDVIALARWRWVSALPVTTLATDPRKSAKEDAEKKLGRIAESKYAPEPPGAEATTRRSGNWGGENKLIMRTHPVPRPASQYPPLASDYANSDQPEDAS